MRLRQEEEMVGEREREREGQRSKKKEEEKNSREEKQNSTGCSGREEGGRWSR